MDQATYDSTMTLLQNRYVAIVTELEAIKGSAILNQPDMKAQDGGTTLEKVAKIKQLEESLMKAADAIDRHIKLKDTIDAGSQAPWTFETQLGL